MADQTIIEESSNAKEQVRFRRALELTRGSRVRVLVGGQAVFDGTVGQDRIKLTGELVIRGVLERIVDGAP